MLEKVLDLKKKSMFLTDTSEDIYAYFRYITSKKKTSMFFSKWTPLLGSTHIDWRAKVFKSHGYIDSGGDPLCTVSCSSEPEDR